MRPLDVAVAGCGVAGLAAALLLARDGHRVTLFERFETARPIGSGLMIQPTGLAVLRAAGLDGSLLAAGARIERLFGRTRGGRTVLDIRYAALGRAGGFGIGVHRADLFAILHDAALAAGVAIETGAEVTGSGIEKGGRRLTLARGSAGPFELVVDALGTRTPLAPPCGRALAYGALWATLDWPGAGFDPAALEQRYHAARRMVGVLPVGGGRAAFFWSLRADRLERWRRDGLAAWRDEVAALWPATVPLLAQIDDPDRLCFARYAHRTLATPVGERLIHIGDAWHSASPQLGQGANMALLDAWALAAALRGPGDLPARLADAVARRRGHVRRYQALSALFTPVYQSDSRLLPLLRDTLVGPLSRLWPATRIQAALVSGLVGDPLGPLGLGRV